MWNLAAVLAFVSTWSLFTAQELTLELKPTSCVAPCSIEALISIPDKVQVGTQVCFTLDNPEDKASTTCWPLEFHETTVRIRNIPKGFYIIGVEVAKHKARGHLTVLGT